jgi:hypothetical protein
MALRLAKTLEPALEGEALHAGSQRAPAGAAIGSLKT